MAISDATAAEVEAELSHALFEDDGLGLEASQELMDVLDASHQDADIDELLSDMCSVLRRDLRRVGQAPRGEQRLVVPQEGLLWCQDLV